MDLIQLPPSAFKLYRGKRGDYYECQFELGLTFGTELRFQLLHNSKIFGKVTASYELSDPADVLLDNSLKSPLSGPVDPYVTRLNTFSLFKSRTSSNEPQGDLIPVIKPAIETEQFPNSGQIAEHSEIRINSEEADDKVIKTHGSTQIFNQFSQYLCTRIVDRLVEGSFIEHWTSCKLEINHPVAL